MALHAAIASEAFSEGTLSEEQQLSLLGKWLLRDVKAAAPILKQRAALEFLGT